MSSNPSPLPPTGYNLVSGTVLTAGETTLPRIIGFDSQAVTAGLLNLTMFTAQKTETCNHIISQSSGTAAVGTTYAGLGAYGLNADGSLTLLAQVVDATLWAATFTIYTRAWSAPWAKRAGQVYAIGLLFTGTTAPTLPGVAGIGFAYTGLAPQLCGQVAAQVALPASIGAGFANSNACYQFAVTP